MLPLGFKRLIMFVYNNLGGFTLNSSIHKFSTRSKNQLHLPTVNLSSI
jgi:hypothetical protein